ncbi:MAG TPA: prolipoprotein diacylglyceryl transferase family protein [Kofleriaceae bacterium]|nr:prolipoprotein diacylglyceryl transferase family protein [Kofleriaceae bacterium]
MRAHLIEWLTPMIGREAALLLAPGWFTCVGLAWLAVCVWVMRAARRRGEDAGAVALVLAAVYVAAVLAGIALPAVIDAAKAAWRGDGLRLRWAGMVSYLGYGAGALVLFALLRRRRGMRPGQFADLLAAPMGLGLAIGRLGCFLAGCDYGQVTSVPWAVRFPQGSPAWRGHVSAGWLPRDRAESLPVHPTQLYEALLGLALCALAVWLSRTAWARERAGRVFAVFVGLYAAGRVAIENLRGDVGRAAYGPWSGAQLACGLALVAVAVWLWHGRRRGSGVGPAAAVSAAAILLVALPVRAQPAGGEVVAEAPAEEGGGRAFRVGGFLAAAAPLNRRDEQVPPLAGGSVTVGLSLGPTSLELDLMSIASSVAVHQSASLAVAMRRSVNERFLIGGRVGFGGTIVNFDDPAFADVGSPHMRLGAEVELALGDSWALTARPLELDLMGARAMGGPLWTYSIQLGVTFRARLGGKKEAARPAPPPQPQPYVPTPTPTPNPNPPMIPWGAERGYCRPDGTCDAGLTCASNRCVRLPPPAPPP